MSSSKSQAECVNGYQVPKWAGKPPSGLHLDVMKDGQMIQVMVIIATFLFNKCFITNHHLQFIVIYSSIYKKLMIDEKKCYFFGRNKDTCDFVTDHASCSRVHAVLMWHKDLNRSFLVDLNSS
jgi:nuclear inhibitor of protein phosphatase 1